MCDKCSDLVVRNYRVNGVERGQVACFSCSHRHGSRITQEMDSRADSSHIRGNPHMDNQEVQKKHKHSPKRFDEVDEVVHKVAPNKVDRQEVQPKWLLPQPGQRQQKPKQTSSSSECMSLGVVVPSLLTYLTMCQCSCATTDNFPTARPCTSAPTALQYACNESAAS